mmetsp:Transcript_8775/g.13261  ORF Transcript_8775/g.13261 Transcript_8775/m.13261 type:complete len:279 (+) Transcript_8775:139-975(+)|eukprot:scaffold9682_cov92-Skeletonema_marinoi.AAC.1
MASQTNDIENAMEKLLRCSDDTDDRRLPEVYLSQDNRRKSFGSISDLLNPEEEVKSDVDLYTHATSDLQTLNDMFAKFRPVANKKHIPDQDDAALFAYMEKRSSVSHGPMGRRGSNKSSRSSMSLSSFVDGFDEVEENSRCGSLSSLLGSLGLNLAPDTAEESPFQVAVRKCPSKRGNAVYRRGKKAAEDGEWEKAVYCYHIALVKQRSYYGEDHIYTAETLNCLGLALIQLDELFGAITALEECLHIRQKLFGPGSEECAVTTNHICRVLDRQNGKS